MQLRGYADVARRVPRRHVARGFGIPARNRFADRTVQGFAARIVFRQRRRSSWDLQLIKQQPVEIAVIVVAMIVLKALVLGSIGKMSRKLDFVETVRLAVILAGGGEFAYVVLNLAAQDGLLDASQRDLFTVAVTLSMALTPIAVIASTRWLAGVKSQAGSRVRRNHRHRPARDHRRLRTHRADRGRILRAQNPVHRAGKQSSRWKFTPLRHHDLLRRSESAGVVARGGATKPSVRARHRRSRKEIRTARLVRRTYPNLRIVARAQPPARVQADRHEYRARRA